MSNTETVQALYAAFGRGDVPGILDLVADNVDWNNTGVASRECSWNGDFSGKAALPAFFKAVGGDLNISVFNPHTFIASGNHVAVALRIESVVPKTGKPIANDAMHLWTFNDRGQVSAYRHFNDTAAELAAWRG